VPYAGLVIVRILVAVSLVLLAAAPASALAGSAPPAQVELVEQPAPVTDDEAVAPRACALAVPLTCAASPPPSEEIAPSGPALARLFRPPRR
jgi:hypothetical protein